MPAFLKKLLQKFGKSAEQSQEPVHYPPEPATGTQVNQRADEVCVRLRAILKGLPPDLAGRVWHPEQGAESILIPFEMILPQLGIGPLQMAFGHLRYAVPNVFAPENDMDEAMIPLPVAEIVSQLDPTLVRYWEAKNRAEAKALPSLAAVPAPAAPPVDVATQPPAPAPAQEPQSVFEHPVEKILSAAASRRSSNGHTTSFTKSPPTIPSSNLPKAPVLTPGRNGHQPAKTESATPKPDPAKTETKGLLKVGFSEVSVDWPKEVQAEIEQLGLKQAQLELPFELVASGMKRGQLAFTWEELRGWTSPAAPLAISTHDKTSLELPLKVIAPLFLSHQGKPQKAKSKVTVDETIPDPFAEFMPAPARPETVVAAPELPASRAMVPEAQTEPIEPECRNPQQVVSRSANLKGVAGALVALPEGLLVASQLPEDLNPETLAAFVPQIFNRVRQLTGELHRGELTSLTFCLEEVPWSIFRSNGLFFAAFGRQGEQMPMSQLAELAARFTKKN